MGEYFTVWCAAYSWTSLVSGETLGMGPVNELACNDLRNRPVCVQPQKDTEGASVCSFACRPSASLYSKARDTHLGKVAGIAAAAAAVAGEHTGLLSTSAQKSPTSRR